jgi:2-polyprenyl-6-hydroxyphenyl methylase/3-demethylubiquinone-9 3-methyltransferase
MVLRVAEREGPVRGPLTVADIGCGAGTLSMLWAEHGHRVFGIDINAQLIKLATERSRESDIKIDFQLGTATDLPWSDESMDVCLVPELLEHVQDWERCLDEFARVIKPGGVLFLTTTNKLCPRQQEFNLLMYSWYPAFIKRYFEKLAVSTWPELVNHAKYPAVHWFTFYSLRKALAKRGLTSMDRFDVTDIKKFAPMKRLTATAIRRVPILRVSAHMCTPYTMVVARKPKYADVNRT